MKHLLRLIVFAFFADAIFASAQTIGSFSAGSAAVTPGGYVSLYAKNVTENGGSIAGVRFYREANGTSNLQTGSDAYVGMGVYANGMWTFAAPTTGLSGTQTYYAVAYDTAGNASSVASVTASVSGSGFSNWSTLEPFLAKVPLSIGQVFSTSVINFGTTVYTGPLDTTITLDRIRGDNGPNRSGDGAAFINNGSPPLPLNRGSVYEFTINPQTGSTPNWTTSQIAFPGPLRFMIDTSGDIYFTGDHYATDLNIYLAGTPVVGSVAASPATAAAGTAVTLTASGVSESISPAPSLNANTGSNVLAAVCNVQFFLETNGVSGLQTDTDRLLGSGTQNGSTWTLSNVSTMGLVAGAYTVYAVGVDPAGNTSTQTTSLTITSAIGNQPPTVTTSAATGVTTNATTLNGSLNPNGQSTAAQFEYGLTTSYGTSVALNGTFTGSNNVVVSTNLAGLTPATTYHFRLDATNAGGLAWGSDQSFTTATNFVIITNQPPGVTTLAASGVATNAATLSGSVNPNGQSTTAQFEYGLTMSYGTSVALSGTFTGSNSIAVSTNLTGLTAGTTYHFRLAATNANGLTLGNDQSFTTATGSGGTTTYGGILAAWEVTGLAAYGPSPLAAASNAPNVTVTGLTRGSGVGTVPTAAGSAWGGTGFVFTNEAAAITGNSFATFSVSNSTPGTISYTNIAAYNIRRSNTGSSTGIWQYQLGNGAFTDIGSAITWGSVTTSAGNAQAAIDLSGIAALQNVPAGTNVAFRIVLWGGTGTGTWYINNLASGYDLAILGYITTPAAILATPNFTGLTAGQSILAGTDSVSLAGKLSATGPVYPASSESVITSINGLSQTNTFNDATGDFSFAFPTATFSAGAYPITYSYLGNAATLGAAASTSSVLTVTNAVAITNQPPTVSFTNPVNNAAFASPATLALVVTAADVDGVVTNVAFYQGVTKLADVSSAPYNFTWSGVSAGAYMLTAVAADNLGASTTSSVVNVSVTNAQVASTLPPIQTVFVIAMENHNWTQPSPGSSPQQIFGNAAAPFINSLVTAGNSNAAQVSYATHYYNAGVGVHPSEPSYVWAEAGTDFGVQTDNDPSTGSGNIFTAPHLTAQLNAAGIAWKNYQEDLEYSSGPTHSASGSSGAVNPYHGTTQFDYAVKHNPMAFFTDTQNQNVYALTNFLNHLTNNTIGRYNWITPDQFNDMHSALSGGFTYNGIAYTGDQAAVAQGDNFLSKIVPLIMASPAYQNNGLIVIWWDETEGGDTISYTIPEIIISSLAKGNAYVSTLEYSHSSDIKTMEEIFGMNFLSNSIPSGETRASGTGLNNVATVNDFSDLFVNLPSIRVQQPAGGTLVNGSATVDFGSVIVGANTVARTFVVTNGGSVSLTVSSISLSGANPGDFSVSGIALPAVVNAAGSTTFQIAFTPAINLPRVATLQITNNDATASPFVVNLTGQGSVVAPTAFTGSSPSGTNQFNLSFTVGTNQSYRVLASDRVDNPMSNWTQTAAGIALTNPVILVDTNNFKLRFYRVVSP
ncbi:MAG: choice-of-anchor D domain-containing protein [Verrucomicrobiota bacterium]